MKGLKEAIAHIKEWEDELPPVITKTLLDLAEQVVSLEGKMPEKHKCDWSTKSYTKLERVRMLSRNTTIDICTKAFVGMLGEKSGYCSIVKNGKTLKKATDIDRARVDGRNSYRAEILKKMGGIQ